MPRSTARTSAPFKLPETPPKPKQATTQHRSGSSAASSSSRSKRNSADKKVLYLEVDSDGEARPGSPETEEEEQEESESEVEQAPTANLKRGRAGKPTPKARALASSKSSKAKGKDDDVFVISDSDDAEDQDVAEEEDEDDFDQDSDDSEPVAKRKKQEKKHAASSTSATPASSRTAAAGQARGKGKAPASAASRGTTDAQGRKVIELAKAPKEKPAPTQISQTMVDFLLELQDPEKNDRDWFQQHDAVYRYIWDNWNTFIENLLPRLMEVDETVPYLPTKDMVYRIYRDVRFSSDKTPYKKYMSATLSRGGRKGHFAGYHIEIYPGGRSFLAGGRWSPPKEHITIFRQNIIDDTPAGRRLKAVLSTPEFTEMFGPAKKDGRGKGKRCNVFGFEDELKVAPKMEGVDKTHPEIDWLKLRSFIVSRTFTDSEVLSDGFIEMAVDTCRVIKPLIECLNDIIYPPPTPPSSDDEQDE